MKAVEKYLAQWAEPEARLSSPLRVSTLQSRFARAVVIPCSGEDQRAMLPITQAATKGALVIVVVNARADADQETLRANAQLIGALAVASLPNVLVLERVLPADQGVGLARKIGCDVALSLWHQGQLASRFIHTTDADADLPPDYGSRADLGAGEAGVVLYPFEHRLELGFERAMQLYELSLHYYVRGLAWAGSPWAFHTLGSTIAIDAEVYAQVRGFPRRAAAEDFYLLAKAAKIAKLETLDGAPIVLAGT